MINIEIKDAEKVNGRQSAFISFDYDEDLIDLMREQPSRFWHRETKEWEVPVNYLLNIIDELINVEVIITGSTQKPHIEVPEGFEFVTPPYEHQLIGFEYGLNNDRFLLADEPGLGKSKQVIDIAMAKRLMRADATGRFKHCLIVCGVNSLKWNWQAEIATHSGLEGYILGTRVNSKGNIPDPTNKGKLEDLINLPDNYFLITNVESLRDKDISNRIKELCDNGTIGMVAIDEIHMCKDPSSQQGKGILKMQPETRIAITGTPLMNTPMDIYIILKWLGYEKHSFYQFKNHYCLMGGFGGHEVLGYRNLGQLREHLESVQIRRLKKDVLDLPPKIRTTEYVQMTKAQTGIYNEVLREIRDNIDKIKLNPNPLTQLIRLRQATGYPGILSTTIKESAKLDRLDELIKEIVANEGKCIVFSNWTGVLNPVFDRLKQYNPAIITGEVQDREAEQDKFMKDDSCKVILGTIGAMGNGLTLTAASTVIFLDSPWNRAKKEQAEDRAHRIGTTSTVNIITLVCKNTIDERIEELIEKKGVMADMLVDGIVDLTKPEMIDFLIS